MSSATQNVTFRLPKDLVANAKRVANDRGKTLTALVLEGLVRATSGNEAYDAARERQLALIGQGLRLRDGQEPYAQRDDLHER